MAGSRRRTGARWRAMAGVLALASLFLGAPAPAAHAARAWQDPLELSSPGADAWVGKEVPSLAVTPSGEVVLAWREGAGGGSTIKVVEKPLGEPPIGAQTLGASRNPPSVAATADGRAFVAWVGSSAAGWPGEDVFVSERQGAGGFGSPKLLGSGAQSYGQPGTAVAANERGDAVVLFTRGTWNDQRLWSARRSPDGVWREPQPVTESLGDAVWRLHAGMSETGEAVFAWLSWDPGRGNTAWTAIERSQEPPAHVRRMQSAGNRSTLPSLSVDKLGNAVVSWIELGSGFVGEVRAAVRAPGKPFGAAIDIGGMATDHDPATARLSEDGRALVTWQTARPNGPNGASLGGVMAATGLVPSGVFARPEQVTQDLVDTPLTLAVDPLGNAVFLFEDWDTGELRVVRRSVAGRYGRQRAVLPCPRQRTYPLMATVDPLGNASLLWTESNFASAGQGLRLSQDRPSATFSPDPCPPPPPPLTWTPKDPAPGQSVTFDASGLRDARAVRNTFKWDLDGDGTYETDTGESPTTAYTFRDAGQHRVGLAASTYSQTPGSSSTSSGYYTIRVGSPPQPTNEYPTYRADPRPPDLPDESPWPFGPDAQAPPVPPLPDLPVVRGLQQTTATLLARPALLPVNATQTRRLSDVGLVLEVPRTLRARAILKDGVPVQLTAARTAQVRLSLRAASPEGIGAPDRGRLAGSSVVRVRKRRAALVRLELSRTGRRLLRKGRVKALTVEAIPPGSGYGLRQQIRVR